MVVAETLPTDTISPPEPAVANSSDSSDLSYPSDPSDKTTAVTSERERSGVRTDATTFSSVDLRSMSADHPFVSEAKKLLSGRIAETDSVSRHKILSYCEHLRTSYTTHDIDFIRQVFSDNALIIVGQVVKTGENISESLGASEKVKYSVRSKREYIDRLSRIFDSGKEIDIKFSDFSIMRHPTVEGIYGVTLRQQYSCGSYSDDGYLFLLWDFRNKSMPQIHVRTWQPTQTISLGDGELIDISDFNLQ